MRPAPILGFPSSSKKAAIYDGCNLRAEISVFRVQDPQRRQPSTTAATCCAVVAVWRCCGSSKKAAIYDGCNCYRIAGRKICRDSSKKAAIYDGCNNKNSQFSAEQLNPQRRQPSTTAATGKPTPRTATSASSKKAAIYDGCNGCYQTAHMSP